MANQTPAQRRLKYTDPTEWVRQQFNGVAVQGSVNEGEFTGTVNLTVFAAELREYIGAKFSEDTDTIGHGGDPM